MKYYLNLIILLLFSVSAFVAQAAIITEPTFVSCSIYVAAETEGSCKIWYRPAKSKKWLPAFTPVYKEESKEYRLSLVRLQENTLYEVKAEVSKNGGNVQSETAQFKTWDSNPKIAQTISLSSFLHPGAKSIVLNNLSGSADGWIKIIGDVNITAGNEQDFALQIQNCQYVLLEGLKITGGYKHGVFIDNKAENIRLQNCDISGWGRIPVTQNAKGFYLDKDQKEINNDAGIRIEMARNIVVERCFIHDPNGFTNPWDGVVDLGEFKGTPYKFSHPQGPNGIYVKQARGGMVLRYNDIVGSQTHRYNDPVETSQNGSATGGFNKDADIYGNVMAFGQDDGIELDGGQCNVRLFDNRFEQVMCGISTAPNKSGPSYIFNNLVWNLGNSLGISSSSVKNGGGVEHAKGIQFLFHNTMISSGHGMAGVGFGCTEPECKRQLFLAYTRNNIFLVNDLPDDSTTNRAKRWRNSILDQHQVRTNSFDYDFIGNSRLPGGKGILVAATGNEKNAVFGLPAFTNAQQGLLTLKPTDLGIDKGQVIPNFTQHFSGKAPDLGAFESGTSSLTPARPLDIVADKYLIKLQPQGTETLKIRSGNRAKKQAFTIRKSADMDWLTVEPASGFIGENSTVIFRLKGTKGDAIQNGMFFIRLDNGLSVPVTVSMN